MDNKRSHDLCFRILKLWQSSDHQIIMSLSAAGALRHEIASKKQFLIADTRQSNFGLTTGLEKPNFTIIKHPFVEIFRKYCDKTSLIGIKEDTVNGDLWLQLYDFTANQKWYIKLAKSRPPEIALIDQNGTIFVRHGSHGTFTKKREQDKQLLEKVDNDLKDISRTVFAPCLQNQSKHLPLTKAENSGTEKSSHDDIGLTQKTVLSKLKRRLKTAIKSAEGQRLKIPEDSDIKEARLMAGLLQSYAYLVKPDDFELKLQAHITGLDRDMIIPLDPDLKVGANIEALFKKANKLKKASAMGLAIESKNKKHLSELTGDIEILSAQVLSDEQLTSIAKKHKIKGFSVDTSSQIKMKKPQEAKVYKEFKSSTGHSIFVGKGPRENDELTKKAKANDFWLHAAGAAGSHIIIPSTKDIRTNPPETLLNEAAILAIYYSKFKDDFAGEVYLAKKSEIKKQKGMPPGLWNVERCKTMFIRFTSEELRAILNRLMD
jgi:hypothetical protein